MAKILIVEDETALVNSLLKRAQREGFEVLVASDGEEGLRVAKQEKPDLILLDIVMPVMDGMTMLKKMREDPELRDMRVIVLTNLSTDEKIKEAKKAGADYLVKVDFSLDELMQKVHETLHQ